MKLKTDDQTVVFVPDDDYQTAIKTLLYQTLCVKESCLAQESINNNDMFLFHYQSHQLAKVVASGYIIFTIPAVAVEVYVC